MSLGGRCANSFSVLAEASPQASPCLRASPYLPATPGLCFAASSPIVYAQASPHLCPASPQARGSWVFPHSTSSSAVHALPPPVPFLLPAAVSDLPQPLLSRTITPEVVQPTLITRVRSMTGPLPPEAASPHSKQRNSVNASSGLASGMMLSGTLDGPVPAPSTLKVEHPSTVIHGHASSHWCRRPSSDQPLLVASNNPTCSPTMAPCASPPTLCRQLSPLALTPTGCTAPAMSPVAMLPLVLPSVAAGPTLGRTISGGSSPGGGNWTTVAPQRRQSKAKGCQDAPPPAQEVSRLRAEGDTIDLYYHQKEEFVRGWTRDHKQSRSVKSKKQTDFQIEKRRQQSMRDKSAFVNGFSMEADEYGMDY